MKVIHFERNNKADDSEVRKRRLRLNAHHRHLRALVAREFRTIGQKDTLTRRIRAPIEQVIDDMQPEVRHAHKIGVGINERKARTPTYRIAISAALLGKTFPQTAFQPMVQLVPMPLS